MGSRGGGTGGRVAEDRRVGADKPANLPALGDF